MTTSKYYIHASGLVDESITPLIDFINHTPGNLVIGLNSGGGSNAVRCFIQQVLKENADRITLVALVGVYSAAFELFARYSGTKALTFGVAGMFHMASLKCNINAKGEPDGDEAKAIHKGVVLSRSIDRTLAAGVMTSQELEAYDKGEDVYFDFERMKQIFPNAEIWY